MNAPNAKTATISITKKNVFFKKKISAVSTVTWIRTETFLMTLALAVPKFVGGVTLAIS